MPGTVQQSSELKIVGFTTAVRLTRCSRLHSLHVEEPAEMVHVAVMGVLGFRPDLRPLSSAFVEEPSPKVEWSQRVFNGSHD